MIDNPAVNTTLLIVADIVLLIEATTAIKSPCDKATETVLEGIALAETALLKAHPKLGSTKIYIHFKSIDKKYDRIEYWHRLKYWIC